MKTLVHIGYHKTASTLLQSVFGKHPYVHLVPREEVWPRFLQPGSLTFDAQNAKIWLESQRSEVGPTQTHMVISEEEFSGNIHTGGNGGYVAKEVANRLHAVMPDAEIVVFVRNQPDLIESCYRHYVREGGTFTINRYLFDEYKRSFRFPQFSFDHFEFDRLVDYYSQLFDRVHVFMYEELSADSRQFFESFFGRLGIGRSETVEQLADRRVNSRMSRTSIFVARRLNRFYGFDPINRLAFCNSKFVRRLSRRLCDKLDRMQWVGALDRNHSFLTSQMREHIHERFAESNSRLAAMCDLNLGDYNYPLPEPAIDS